MFSICNGFPKFLGGDLVLSLTSTFDAKMRCLSVGGVKEGEREEGSEGEEKEVKEEPTKESNETKEVQAEKTSETNDVGHDDTAFRDPSLHKHCTLPHNNQVLKEDNLCD